MPARREASPSLRALLVWFGLMAVAILNGAFREAVLAPALGRESAHVASTAMLCAFIALVTVMTIRWIHPGTAREAMWIGARWLMLVLLFEFGFGHYVAHKSWSELLADYDLMQGRVWVAVPLVTAAAPYLAGRWRGLFEDEANRA